MSNANDAGESATGEVSLRALRWMELRRNGQAASPEEVCADRPDLAAAVAQRIRILQMGEAALGLDASTVCPEDPFATTPPGVAASGPGPSGRPPASPGPPGYEILCELGRGAMGVVYKARQVGLNRLVAIKMILNAEQVGLAARARFQAEAESVAALRHPNIVQIYEVGEYTGLPFFSLEFCPGGSLDRKLLDGPLTPAEAAELVEVLARAVHAAHQAGIIHRDLKPANVLLADPSVGNALRGVPGGSGTSGAVGNALRGVPGADGTPRRAFPTDIAPKISDFGLAKRLDAAPGSEATRSGAIVGTPAYMAPEQVRGMKLTTAVDVYALGAILYELLASRPPFRGESVMDTLQAVLNDEPIPPRVRRAGVPFDLETICLKCLSKDPSQRYGSAEALADDLARFRAGEPILARPVGAVERLRKWARRRPAVAALLAAVVLVGVLGAAGVWWKYREAEYEKSVAQERTREAEAAAQREREARQEATRAKAEAESRLALNYFAYGRLCAVAARLATAGDRQEVAEARREFDNLRKAIGLLGDDSVKTALNDFQQRFQRWRSGPPPDELKRLSLALAKACRKPWTSLIDKECPALANQVRGLLYDRAVTVANEMANAGNREECEEARREFEELYWGELVMVEDKAVEEAMVRLGEVVREWRPGQAPPGSLRRLADELRRACRLPPAGPRGMRR
jgi:serine/threonine protein kinase